MRKEDVVVATIALARTAGEEALLRASLEQLSQAGMPVYITDGGSANHFVSYLQKLPQFTVFSHKGLWPQAKKSITEAAKTGAKCILYTEPDKLSFFAHHLPEVVANCPDGPDFGVYLSSRSSKGFGSFPPFQQMTESTINHCCREVIGTETDYCYGPFLFNTYLIPTLEPLPENIGWGWRPFLFAMAKQRGLTVDAFVGDFSCPPDQREEDASERIYRMKQMAQNIDGLVLATIEGAKR